MYLSYYEDLCDVPHHHVHHHHLHHHRATLHHLQEEENSILGSTVRSGLFSNEVRFLSERLKEYKQIPR